MKQFIAKHLSDIRGVLSGLDRVRFRGTYRMISTCRGLMNYFWQRRVLLKEFGEFARSQTEALRRDAAAVVTDAGRPLLYVNRPGADKEAIVREIARRDRIEVGLVCGIKCLEMGMGFDIRKDAERKELRLVCVPRNGLHMYHYVMHPLVGLVSVRMQTWLPMTVFVCLNGRRWLARQMDEAGIEYVQRANTFVAVDDVERAQALLSGQLRTNWRRLLDPIVADFAPTWRLPQFNGADMERYWSVDEREWATDVMFRSPARLRELYPKLTLAAMTAMGCHDVMRFLGRLDPAQPRHAGALRRFQGEVVCDLRSRPEGVRVKHWRNRNSVKMYDKEGSVLRVETTINDPRDMKVFRRPTGRPEAPPRWLRMSKGTLDIARGADISQRCNERYLDHLASADTAKTLAEIAARLGKPASLNGRRVRAMNPMEAGDARLLETVARGEFTINGFRNRDVRIALDGPDPDDPKEARRRAAAVSRKIVMLRAHGLVRRVPGTTRYMLTAEGRRVTTAILLARNASIDKLSRAA